MNVLKCVLAALLQLLNIIVEVSIGAFAALVVLIAVAFVRDEVITGDIFKPDPLPMPALSFDQPFETVWREAYQWCLDLETTRPDVNEFQRGYAMITAPDKTFACGPLVRKVEMFNGHHYTFDKLTFEQKVEWRRRSWEKHWRPKIVDRLSEFSVLIPCDIDLASVPYRSRDSVWSRELREIKAWYVREEQRLHDCIQASYFDAEAAVTEFMDSLFSDAFDNEWSDDSLAPMRHLYATDDEMQRAYQSLLQKWRTTQREKYAKNARKWDSYRNDTLLTAIKKGRREERQFEQELAQERYEKEFEAEHGMGPNDTCEFHDERGRVRFRGLCKDYVKQERRLMNETSGWSAMWEELGEMSRDMERQRREREMAEAAAWSALVLSQSEVREGETTPAQASTVSGVAKGGPEMEGSCRSVPDFGKFEPCITTVKCKPKPPFKTCVKRDWAAEKRCLARQKVASRERAERNYAMLKNDPNSDCQRQAQGLRDSLDGVKRQSSPGRGISK